MDDDISNHVKEQLIDLGFGVVTILATLYIMKYRDDANLSLQKMRVWRAVKRAAQYSADHCVALSLYATKKYNEERM